MRRILVLMFAVASAGLAISAEAQSRRGVTVYADAEYRGASETFYSDVPNFNYTRVGNDRASSVRVDPGCTVTLYAGGDYRGRPMQLSRDVRSLAGTSVGNDTVSSLRLQCGQASGGGIDWRDRPGVALYRDGGFTGRREIFYDGDSDLRNNRIGTRAASSVRVAPGCRATLFANPGYRGRSAEIDSDVRNLGQTGVGNDSVSSLRVQCDNRRHDDRWDDRRDDRWDDRRDDRRGDRRDTGGGWNPWERRSGSSVTLYAGGDYSGRSETFYGDVDHLSGTEVGNDSVSSLQIDPGCRLVLFEHPNYRGHSSVLEGDVPDMRRTALGNDRASSLRLDCGRSGRGGYDDRYDERGVTLYSDVDFRGRNETLQRDVRDLGRTEVGNDRARSVRVPRGCRALLYRQGDFRGEPLELTRDEANLGYTSIGNDELSSIEVDCR